VTVKPGRYRSTYALDVATQITVSLPDDQVAFVDTEVASGNAASRAAVISRALRQEMRRTANAHDIAVILKQTEADMDDLAVHNATDAHAVFGELA